MAFPISFRDEIYRHPCLGDPDHAFARHRQLGKSPRIIPICRRRPEIGKDDLSPSQPGGLVACVGQIRRLDLHDVLPPERSAKQKRKYR